MPNPAPIVYVSTMTNPADTAGTHETFTLSITEKAARRILDIIRDNGLPDTAGLRAGVVEGGCSGFNYDVEIVTEPANDDLVLVRHGARVFVNDFSMPYITGMTIDWVSSMLESRFVFQNPNATGTCGCGISFTVK